MVPSRSSIQSRAEFDLPRVLGHSVHDFIEDTSLDHEPRTRTTTLAVVEEDGAGRTGDRGVEMPASLRAMLGDFPPSSRLTFFRFRQRRGQ